MSSSRLKLSANELNWSQLSANMIKNLLICPRLDSNMIEIALSASERKWAQVSANERKWAQMSAKCYWAQVSASERKCWRFYQDYFALICALSANSAQIRRKWAQMSASERKWVQKFALICAQCFWGVLSANERKFSLNWAQMSASERKWAQICAQLSLALNYPFADFGPFSTWLENSICRAIKLTNHNPALQFMTIDVVCAQENKC